MREPVSAAAPDAGAVLTNPSVPRARPVDVASGRGFSRARVTGWVLLGCWAAGAAGLVWYAASGYDAELYAKYLPRLFDGLWVTLKLVVISVTLGALLAMPLALARLSESRAVNGSAFGYSYLFRGTPLLAQVFLVYYGAGQFNQELQAVGLWWLFREALYCVILTFTLNTAAYQAEIFRGAIQAVPDGQWEAGRAVGLSEPQIFLKIIVPQALAIALRPFGNEIILMIKGSAIASVVTVFELMGETRLAFSRTFDFTPYLWAALIYLVLVEVLRRVWDRIEIVLTRHLKR
ncbi:MAG: ABC transporter permease [Pseudomonadota bacterium]